MTRAEYLTQFERHLRVAEPKRGEIIAEIVTHLDEVDGGPKALGDPKTLAKRFNRTHIGMLGNRFMFHALPLVAVIIILIDKLSGIPALRAGRLTYNESMLGFFFPILLAIPYGMAMRRMFRPIRDVVAVVFTTFAFATICGIAYGIIAKPWSFYHMSLADMVTLSAITTTFSMLLAVAVACLAMLLAHPFDDLRLLSHNASIVVSGIVSFGMLILFIPVVLFAGMSERVTTMIGYPVLTLLAIGVFIRCIIHRRQYLRRRQPART